LLNQKETKNQDWL